MAAAGGTLGNFLGLLMETHRRKGTDKTSMRQTGTDTDFSYGTSEKAVTWVPC